MIRLESEDVAIESQGIGNALNGNTNVGDTRIVGHRQKLSNRAAPCSARWKGSSAMAGVNASTAPVKDDTFAAEVEQSKGLVLVDFWATWCGPCLMVAPVLEQLAGQYDGRARILKLDVDSNQKTAMRFNVRRSRASCSSRTGSTWTPSSARCRSRPSRPASRSTWPDRTGNGSRGASATGRRPLSFTFQAWRRERFTWWRPHSETWAT